jgi:hypothetical protein
MYGRGLKDEAAGVKKARSVDVSRRLSGFETEVAEGEPENDEDGTRWDRVSDMAGGKRKE